MLFTIKYIATSITLQIQKVLSKILEVHRAGKDKAKNISIFLTERKQRQAGPKYPQLSTLNASTN